MKKNQFIYIVSVSFNDLSDSNPKDREPDQGFLIYHSYRKPRNVILLECSTFFPYLTPIRIVDALPFIDVFELDKIVKQHMYCFGIENVRGGSYFEEFLPLNKLKTLESELNTIQKAFGPIEPTDRTYIYDKIKDYYRENKVEDTTKELQRIEYEWQHYKNAKQRYEKIKNYRVFGEPATFGWHIMDNLQWLKDFIRYGDREDIANRQTKENYKKIVQVIKQIVRTYISLRDFSSTDIYFEKPEFLLDSFFYHRKSIIQWQLSVNKTLDFIDKIEFMTNYIVNRLAELEYDLSTHPENPEEYYRMSKLLLSKNMEFQ
jgi:hypothetical protein